MPKPPAIFRVLVQVGNLDRARDFYSRLFGTDGRAVGGGRYYFDCGSVIFGLVDVSRGGMEPRSAPEDIYFSVADLEPYYARAKALDCLSTADVHGANGGEITVRPWGERSFYCEDPFGNGLCFVDERTLFTGR